MAAAPLIDTHIWLWWVEGTSDLTRAERRALDSLPTTDRPKVSVISFWEVSLLVQSGRYTPGRRLDDWLKLAAGPDTIELVQIGKTIARELFELPRSFHRDPADRIIIATARALRLPLLTHDDRIRRSGLVELWKPPS